MANLETQMLDDVIVKTRRKMLSLGGAALAGMFFAEAPSAKAQSTSYTDADILNFALNLEYLEANFYYLAAFGTTIDVSNAASTAAGALKLGINGVGTQGMVTAKANAMVPFSSIAIASYAIEVALEEGKHVNFLRGALGAAAVAQPAIDLMTSFNTLASAASNGTITAFDPFSSDDYFLVGAYIFEDVGVTAYHGAAPLITTPAYLEAAAGILAVEAYHAGLIRTSIFATDTANNSTALTDLTTAISALRSTLSDDVTQITTPLPAGATPNAPDDFGVAVWTTPKGLGDSTTGVTAARITDADPITEVAFARNTSQVLNIVTGGGAAMKNVATDGTITYTAVTPAKGVFYPNGMNGLFK